MNASVLMFCPQWSPVVGGAERQAEKLARKLRSMGCRIEVLTPRVTSESASYEEGNGLAVRRYEWPTMIRNIRGLGLANLQLLRQATRRAVLEQIDRFDLLHASAAAPVTAFAVAVAKSVGRPTLCKVAMAGNRNDFTEMRRIGLGGRKATRVLLRDVDRWVATTDDVVDSLDREQVPRGVVRKIPNGVELPPDGRWTGRPVRRFLYLGRLSSTSERDVPTLIRAFDRLAHGFDDAELAIVGSGNEYESTRRIARQAKNAGKIHTPGEQPPDAWFAWADCFVLPSRREGLSNALLEAMSYGLPCVANDIPSNREVLAHGDAGVLVELGDEDQLLHCLQQFAVHREVAEAYGARAEQRVRACYSIGAVAEAYLQLYDELL